MLPQRRASLGRLPHPQSTHPPPKNPRDQHCTEPGTPWGPVHAPRRTPSIPFAPPPSPGLSPNLARTPARAHLCRGTPRDPELQRPQVPARARPRRHRGAGQPRDRASAKTRGASWATLRLHLPPGQGRRGGHGSAAVVSESPAGEGRHSKSGATEGRGLRAPTSEGGRDVGCTPKWGFSSLPDTLGVLWEPPGRLGPAGGSAELRAGARATPKAEVMANLVPGLPAPPPPGTVWAQTGWGGWLRGDMEVPQYREMAFTRKEEEEEEGEGLAQCICSALAPGSFSAPTSPGRQPMALGGLWGPPGVVPAVPAGNPPP